MNRTQLDMSGDRSETAAAGAGRSAVRAAYRTPQLRVIGDAVTLTQRNWFAPGNVDGRLVWRRTG